MEPENHWVVVEGKSLPKVNFQVPIFPGVTLNIGPSLLFAWGGSALCLQAISRRESNGRQGDRDRWGIFDRSEFQADLPLPHNRLVRLVGNDGMIGIHSEVSVGGCFPKSLLRTSLNKITKNCFYFYTP